MVLDHEGYLPCYAVISDGSVHDVKVAWQIPFPAGTVVVYDRGYNDYRLFAYWTQAGVFFVTRMKDNALFEVVDERTVPQNRTSCATRLSGSLALAPRRNARICCAESRRCAKTPARRWCF